MAYDAFEQEPGRADENDDFEAVIMFGLEAGVFLSSNDRTAEQQEESARPPVRRTRPRFGLAVGVPRVRIRRGGESLGERGKSPHARRGDRGCGVSCRPDIEDRRGFDCMAARTTVKFSHLRSCAGTAVRGEKSEVEP